MTASEFTSRLATPADIPALTELVDAAIVELQRAYLDEAQIASSRAIIGVDTDLIGDGTDFVVEAEGDIAGCGGWSRRATLYGGNQTPGRDSQLLDAARPLERLTDSTGGVPVPLVRMEKPVDPSLLA